jgi:hypothetical protein
MNDGRISMTKAPIAPHVTSEAAIFASLWETEDRPLSVELARHIIRLQFSDQDRARMHALAVKNQEGHLTASERAELDSYVKVGDLVAILQSKARRLLRSQAKATNG